MSKLLDYTFCERTGRNVISSWFRFEWMYICPFYSRRCWRDWTTLLSIGGTILTCNSRFPGWSTWISHFPSESLVRLETAMQKAFLFSIIRGSKWLVLGVHFDVRPDRIRFMIIIFWISPHHFCAFWGFQVWESKDENILAFSRVLM